MFRAHFMLSGRVQGVFCRSHVRALAQDQGIHGTVRNKEDGRVEVYAEAESEEKLKIFEDSIKSLRAPIEVVELEGECKPVEKAGFNDFRIVY